MGRRLVVTVVLDEGDADDVFDQLADVVSAGRRVVSWQVERYVNDGEERDSFGPAPGTDPAELEAVSA